MGNPTVNWDEPVIPKRAFSLLGWRSPSQTLLPLAAWQGSMAFKVHAPNHFQRMADARPSRPSPPGALRAALTDSAQPPGVPKSPTTNPDEPIFQAGAVLL